MVRLPEPGSGAESFPRAGITAKNTRQELGVHFARNKKMALAKGRWMDSRKIEGKRFICVRKFCTKPEAEALAAKYRRMGYLARIMNFATWERDLSSKHDTAYEVYVWKGKQ